MNGRIERVRMCRQRSEYLANTNTSDEIMFGLLAHRIIDDMPFSELAVLFDFSKTENGEAKGSVDFKAHLIVGHREEVYIPVPPKGRLLNDTSVTAKLLTVLRSTSSASIIAVAAVGLFAEKLNKSDQEGLLLIALLSFICGAISHWALINWYPKTKCNA